jgi:AcrR family transcriptional regulator
MLDRKTALLDAAVAEIATRGTRGLRVERVAAAAGVSVALIYHYFGDRATLLQSALEHIGERADRYTTRPPGSTARATVIATLLEEIQEDADVRTNSAAWGELRDTAIFDPRLRPTLAALSQRWIDDIAALVRSGHADGSIASSVVPEQAAVRLTAMVEGISGRWLTGLIDTDEARDHVAAAVDALLAERHGDSDAG